MKRLFLLAFIIACNGPQKSNPVNRNSGTDTLGTDKSNSWPNDELYEKYNIKYSASFSACEEMFYEFFPYWMRDSTGLNGFRMVYAEKILNCLPNQNWPQIEKYFGSPFSMHTYDSTYGSNEGTTKYVYQLSYFFPGEYKAIGNLFLWIEVKNGSVIFCKIHEVDG